MIVILNNGTRIRISEEELQSIAKNMISKEAMQWQCHIDPNAVGFVNLINLKEVSAICKEEDIITNTEALIKELDNFSNCLPNKDTSGQFWISKFRNYLAELIKHNP